MDAISRGVIAFLGIVGVAYGVWLLRGCLTGKSEVQARRNRQHHRLARIDRFLEFSSSITLMIVAGGFLAMCALDCLPNSVEAGTDNCQRIPGMQPIPSIRISYDASLVGRPIVGADLSSLPLTDHDVRVLIRQSPEMWWLNVAGTKITDACLADLGRVQGLTDLCLGRTAITDSGLKQVARAEQLTILSLAGTSITDIGLEHIAKLTDLRELDLRGTRVTDAGLKSLHRLHRLELLFVHRTGVTSDGVRDLAKSLPNAQIDIGF